MPRTDLKPHAQRLLVASLTTALFVALATPAHSGQEPPRKNTLEIPAELAGPPAQVGVEAETSNSIATKRDVHQPIYHVGGPYPDGYHLEYAVSVLEYRQFEAFYIIGKARLDAKGRELTVFLESAPSKGGTWERVARTRSSSSGYYEFSIRPEEQRRYRVVIARDWTSKRLTMSNVMEPKFVGTSHTLEQRRAELAWRLGDNTRTVRTMKPYQYDGYPFKAVRGRWQSFEGGILAEVTRSNGKIYTWFIEGPILSEFLKQGGWTTRMGVPARDAICVELENSCTQLFAGGAIYSNNRGKRTHVYGPSTWAMEIVAAAMSQKNYTEPAWRRNKFNDWIGANNAWCGVFVAWAASASGHADAAPQRDGWSGTLSDLRSSGALKKGRSGLKPGAMVLFDYMNDGVDRATHIGLVVSVSGSTIRTIEGNTTNGTGNPQRGVFYRERPISSVWGTADPMVFVER